MTAHEPRSSGVYLVVCYPYIKVGYSGNIARRMIELRGRRGCRFPADLPPREPLALVHHWPRGGMEKPLHDALADHRAIGEWYYADPWMVRWVNRQAANTFTPGAVAAMSEGRSPQTWWRYPDGTPTPYFEAHAAAMLATHPDARTAPARPDVMTGGTPTDPEETTP